MRRRPRLADLPSIVKEAYGDWKADKAARLGAALAYYAVFAIGPLLALSIAVAGLVVGDDLAREQVLAEVRALLGESGARFASDTLLARELERDAGVGGVALGAATLALAALGVFRQLRDALDTIWEVQVRPRHGLWSKLVGTVRDDLSSFMLVLGTGFLLLVSLALTAGLALASRLLAPSLAATAGALVALDVLVSFASATLVFAAIYKVLPHVELAWRDVAFGALVTGALFTLGKYALGMYLARGAVGTAFGAASALVVVLVWVYWSAQVLFFGAELTQVWSSRYGTRIRPSRDALAVDEAWRSDARRSRDERDRGAA